jgi:hypothetical protein
VQLLTVFGGESAKVESVAERSIGGKQRFGVCGWL